MMERFKLLINQYRNQLMNPIGINIVQVYWQSTLATLNQWLNGENGVLFITSETIFIRLWKILFHRSNEYLKYFLHFTSGLFWNTYVHFVVPLFFYVLLLIQTQIPFTISMWIIGKNIRILVFNPFRICLNFVLVWN